MSSPSSVGHSDDGGAQKMFQNMLSSQLAQLGDRIEETLRNELSLFLGAKSKTSTPVTVLQSPTLDEPLIRRPSRRKLSSMPESMKAVKLARVNTNLSGSSMLSPVSREVSVPGTMTINPTEKRRASAWHPKLGIRTQETLAGNEEIGLPSTLSHGLTGLVFGERDQALVEGGEDDNAANSEVRCLCIEYGEQSSPPPSCKERWTSFLEGVCFETTVAAMVMINSITLGIEADYMARHWEDNEIPLSFEVLNSAMCAFFLVETATRLLVTGKTYFKGKSTPQPVLWSSFHIFVTGVQVIEECLKIAAIFFGVECAYARHCMRLLRTLRVVSIFPFLDTLHATDELRLLWTSIQGSFKSLCCCMYMLVIATYMFGVPFTQVVTNFKRSHPDDTEANEELDQFYGSLDKSMMSLFQSISEGIHWRELLEPLEMYCSPYLNIPFILYIVVAVFAIMNIVTGIFMDSAMKTAQTDKNHRLGVMMRKIFAEADTDHSGTLTLAEFQKQLEINVDLKLYLKAMEIPDEQATDLFHLLDVDRSGSVDFDEFVYGCLRFQGAAKAIDFAAFMCDWRETSEYLLQMVELNRDYLLRIHSA